MPVPNREAEDRVNILLPFGDALTARMMQQPAGARWAENEIAGVRAAAADQELAGPPAGIADEQIRSVLRALVGNQAVRGAMGIADATVPDDVAYLTPMDFDQVGPPLGAALVIPEIGLISIPASAEGDRGIQAITKTLSAVAGIGTPDVVMAVPVYAAHLLDDGDETNGLGFMADTFLAEEEDERWFEAELSIGAAAEVIPWGVARVNAPRAWTRGFFGQGIRVAVVDTGVGPHPDLPAPVASATFVPGTNSADDDQGHGTHVAGTVLARKNGLGVIGVAPRASLMRAKVLDRTGRGTSTAVAAGIVWAANNGARIINLSLGGGPSADIDRAVAYARSRGVAICAAAGNDFCKPVISPARNPLCIAVAATDKNNKKAPFSNCGPELDLAAPGVDILSTVRPASYGTKSGTSMATPHVAGVGALVLSKRPALNPAQLQTILEKSAIPLGPANQFGHGLVQADRAIAITTTENIADERPIATPAAQVKEPEVAGGRRR